MFHSFILQQRAIDSNNFHSKKGWNKHQNKFRMHSNPNNDISNYHQMHHQAYNQNIIPATMFNYANPAHQNNNQNFWQLQSYHHPTLLHQNQMIYPQLRLHPTFQTNSPLQYQI